MPLSIYTGSFRGECLFRGQLHNGTMTMLHTINRKAAAFSAVLLFLILLTGQSVLPQDDRFPRDQDIESEIISIINRYRIRDGRTPLSRNPDLDYLAMQQADYMKVWMPFTSGDINYHIDAFG